MKTTSESMPMLSFNYGFYTPGGDLKNRFGNNSAIGSLFQYKTKSNFVFGAEGTFFFGRNVKENHVLDQLASPDGEVFDKSSQPSAIIFFERGFTLSASVGKIFPVFGPNPNSGILLRVGGGFMQHKIRIEHQNNRIPQLENDYIKGYDRLTNGPMLNQFVGYMLMSNNKFANFYLGVEAIEGFTKSRRGYNYDTRMPDTANRLDLMYGVKAGICILFYKRTSTEYYIR
ncbi:MAG: hypothetical protein V4616_01025 [Bacteroidota bacterium]